MSARDVLDQIRQRAEEDLRYAPSMRARERIEAALRQNAALTAVLDLHRAVGNVHGVCTECLKDYPCDTVAAITDHLRSDQ